MDKIALAGCVIIAKNEILLLHRIKRDWYELPGGKVESEESPEDTARRELKEELLCDVEIIREIDRKDFTEDGHVMNYIWFLARIKEGQTPSIGETWVFDHFKYLDIDKLENYKLSPNMKSLVKELRAGNISVR